MVYVTCIEKIRDKSGNNIVAYKLQDINGEIRTLSSDDLKLNMLNKNINVNNLKLTQDNRLIDKPVIATVTITANEIARMNCERTISFKSNVNLNEVGIKAKAVGTRINTLTKDLYTVETYKDITVVSDKQISLPDSCEELFLDTVYCSIDLRNVDTSNVNSMKCMFSNCMAKEIDLSTLDTSNVRTMYGMFNGVELDKLDLRNFNTRNVKHMSGMFSQSKINKLDISSFDTSNVIAMDNMFLYCEIRNGLDIRNFNTSKVKDMGYMFCKCKTPKIDISSFDTRNVFRTEEMFSGCETDTIDTRHFNMDKVTNARAMFENCKVRELLKK